MNQNEDLFEACWDLKEFQSLIEQGLSFGSKYFFLVKVTGLFFLVRDTDSEGIDSNPKQLPNKVFRIDAEGLNEDLVDIDSRYEKTNMFYKGDVCEWYRLSEELLAETKEKLSRGYEKIKISSYPLELDKKYQDPSNPEALMAHKISIWGGGSCPIDCFNAQIKFQYIKQSEVLDLEEYYGGKPLFVDKEEAEIINFYLKFNHQTAQKEDFFNIRVIFESKGRYVEAIQVTLYLEECVEAPHHYRYYRKLAELQLHAEDHISSLRSNLKALSYREKDVPLISNIGNRLRDLGRLDEAKEYYHKALKINPSDSILLYNLEKLDRIINEFPTKLDSLYQALMFHFYIRRHGGIMHKKYMYSKATESIIITIAFMIKPHDQLDNIDKLTKFNGIKSVYETTSKIISCKEFVKDMLQHSIQENKLKEMWNIGLEADLDYKNIDSFLADVDWDQICFLVNRSWSDAFDSQRMEYIRSKNLV